MMIQRHAMTPNEPFLLLNSPSVADLGHANVVADTVNQPSSGFDDLEEQCDFLMKLARQNDGAVCLAVERPVTQWSTSRRDAIEWLVCSSLPENPDDAEKVRSAMRQLWLEVYHTEDEASANWLKKAEKKRGNLFLAPRMTEITTAFRSHPEIRGISWRPITPPPAAPSPPDPTPRRYIMRTLIGIIGILTLWVVLTLQKKNEDPNDQHPVGSVSHTASNDDMTWNEWHGVLSSDDRWKSLLDGTGGKEAYRSWEDAKKLVQQEASQPGGLEKLKSLLKDKQPEKPDANVTALQQQAVQKLDEWMKLYCKEFKLSILKPQALSDDPLTRYLKQATPPWYVNKDNQISNAAELPVLKNAGKELDMFASIFGKPEPMNLSNRLSVIWKALDAFSKSNTNDDVKPFQDVVNRELQGLNASPDNYIILTLKDSERVTRLRNVFGCEEFGVVVSGRRFEKEERWEIIKKSLDSAITQMERMSGSERILIEGLKAAFRELDPEEPAPSKPR